LLLLVLRCWLGNDELSIGVTCQWGNSSRDVSYSQSLQPWPIAGRHCVTTYDDWLTECCCCCCWPVDNVTRPTALSSRRFCASSVERGAFWNVTSWAPILSSNLLGPFYGAIAVPSVTPCRCCCCRCGHRFYIAFTRCRYCCTPPAL